MIPGWYAICLIDNVFIRGVLVQKCCPNLGSIICHAQLFTLDREI